MGVIATSLGAAAFFLMRQAPRTFARALRWSTLVGTNRQVTSGRVTAAGLFVARDSVCREQVLVGALADDLATGFVRQSIAGSVLCASVVLFRRTLLYR
jgi:hypothetical protein